MASFTFEKELSGRFPRIKTMSGESSSILLENVDGEPRDNAGKWTGKAQNASVKAFQSGRSNDHATASKLHKKAASAYPDGHWMKADHEAMSAIHDKHAGLSESVLSGQWSNLLEDLGDVPESAEEKFHGQKVSQSAFDATTKANQTQLQPHHVEAAKIHDAATEATAESKPMLSAAHSQLASYHRAEAGKITGDEDQTKPGTNDVSDPNNAGRDGKALKEGQPDHESAFAKLSASIQKKEGYSKQAADATAASIGRKKFGNAGMESKSMAGKRC